MKTLLLVFLLSSSAFAEGPGWAELYDTCRFWDMPEDFTDWSKKAVGEFEPVRAHTGADLNRFVNVTCRSYAKQANAVASIGAEAKSSVTLANFLSERDRVLAEVAAYRARSDAMAAYLDTKLQRFERYGKIVGLKPMRETRCGKRMFQQLGYLEAQKISMARQIESVKGNCVDAAVAEARLEGAAKDAAILSRKVGQGAPDRAPASIGGTAQNRDSKITGKLKEKKLP